MKQALGALCMLFGVHSASAQSTYDIKSSLVIVNHDCTLTRLCAVMPVPESNIYQTIEHFSTTDGEVCQAANNENCYLRTVLTGKLPAPGDSITISERYSATLYPMRIDMAQFKEIYPYDTGTELYRRYTADLGNDISITHPDIVKTAEMLWKKANGSVLYYARLCYEYVPHNFRYMNPGFHNIPDIMSGGGGDCGNLSAVFVSLLRCKGVPARIVTTIRPDGSHHTWADFYLERYGWVPVDVTLKHDRPDGDYFGYCAGDGIVMSFDLGSEISYDGTTPFRTDILQSYFYWYWFSAGSKINVRQRVNNRLTASPTAIDVYETTDEHVSLGWEKVAQVSGYRLTVSNQSHKEFTCDVDSGCTSYVFHGLRKGKLYRIAVTPLRRVDNIVTEMSPRAVTVRI